MTLELLDVIDSIFNTKKGKIWKTREKIAKKFGKPEGLIIFELLNANEIIGIVVTVIHYSGSQQQAIYSTQQHLHRLPKIVNTIPI